MEGMASLEISNIQNCNRKEELINFMLYSLPQEFELFLFNCYKCIKAKLSESECPQVSISDFLVPLFVVLPKVTD